MDVNSARIFTLKQKQNEQKTTKIFLKQLAISQSPGSSRANPFLEEQEIWQYTFKLS
jgi:hypothetical protein